MNAHAQLEQFLNMTTSVVQSFIVKFFKWHDNLRDQGQTQCMAECDYSHTKLLPNSFSTYTRLK